MSFLTSFKGGSPCCEPGASEASSAEDFTFSGIGPDESDSLGGSLNLEEENGFV